MDTLVGEMFLQVSFLTPSQLGLIHEERNLLPSRIRYVYSETVKHINLSVCSSSP